MKFLYSLTIVGLLTMASQFSYAQCSSCTYTVSSNSNGSYNLNSGQTLCILSGATFSGNINMNGGTLCNSGTINGGNLNINGSSSKVYNYGTFRRSSMNLKGQFYNYGLVDISGDLNINSDGEFYNELGATLNVGGNINNNKIFKNYGSVTVNGSYQANGGSSANLNAGTMTVKGNMQLNAVFSNSGPLRIEGSMAVNGNATFSNAVNTAVNVLGAYQNNGNTWNDGSIEVGGTFTNNGGGIFTNNKLTNIYGNFMNNGSINGDVVDCNAFLVGGGSVVQNGGGSITNNDFCASMFPGSNFSTNNGNTTGSTFCSCSQVVNPLPIELTAFTAECGSNGVELTWTTATEINNAFFTVYRSADAISWETLTVMTGAGNSNAELNYTYTDSRALGEVSYYRLQQTDYDGATEYFDPISTNCGAKGQNHDLSVYPNPADEQFTVSITASKADAQTTVELLDITGKRVNVRTWSVQAGQNYLTVERNGLVSGTYFVHISSATGEFPMQKVVLR